MLSVYSHLACNLALLAALSLCMVLSLQFFDCVLYYRARTRIIKHTHQPVWEEAFQVPVADEVKEVGFLLKDASYFGKLPALGTP